MADKKTLADSLRKLADQIEKGEQEASISMFYEYIDEMHPDYPVVVDKRYIGHSAVIHFGGASNYTLAARLQNEILEGVRLT